MADNALTIISKLKSRDLDIRDFLKEHTDKDIILKRLLSRVPDDLDTSPGNYIWDSLSPDAIEFVLAYIALDEVLDRGFAQTSFGVFLTRRAAEHGVVRKEATKSTGMLTVEGNHGAEVMAGDRFSNTVTDGTTEITKYYVALQGGRIGLDGKIKIPIEAVVTGEMGNALAGEINNNAGGVSGIVKVYNEQPIEDGVEEEGDVSLLPRYLERVRKPPSSGNKYDYVRWAKEVPGVGQCIPKPLWNGPGTVKLIVLGENGEILSPEIVTNVKTHIDPTDGKGDGNAPIGALVTVVTASPVAIAVTIPLLQLENGYLLENVQLGISKALTAQLLATPPDSVIRRKDIESAINSVPGTLDFGDVLLNGCADNIRLEDDQKATLGEVTYT